MPDLLTDATEPDIALDDEPDIPLDEPEIPLDEPAPEPPAPVAVAALMQVLPADFPLPGLIRFVPDARLRIASDQAATYALTLDVRGAEGLQAADAALTVIRGNVKAIEEHFGEPVEIANRLHKSLTGTRAEWIAAGKAACDTVGRRIYAEKQRLDALAAEERRKAQAEADRQAREEARKRAEEAAKAQAPVAVVENLRKQAETAQAAPVATPVSAPKLAGTSTVKNWTCTIAGTPREVEQNPCMADLTDVQRLKVLELMRDVVDGKAPLAAFELNWSYLKKRAKSDESTLAIRNIEAYDAGGTRAKGTRGR